MSGNMRETHSRECEQPVDAKWNEAAAITAGAYEWVELRVPSGDGRHFVTDYQLFDGMHFIRAVDTGAVNSRGWRVFAEAEPVHLAGDS